MLNLDFAHVADPLRVKADGRLQEIDDAARLSAMLGDVRRAGDGGVGEGVRVGKAEDDNGQNGGQQDTDEDAGQIGRALPCFKNGFPCVAALVQPNDGRQVDDECQRGEIDPRGDGQPQRNAENEPPSPPPFEDFITQPGGADGGVDGERGQRGSPCIHRVKVGLLNGHNGRCHQSGRN